MPIRLPLSVVLAAPLLIANGEPMPRITSDSHEYCTELVGRFARLPGAAVEPARSLAADGVRLCEEGQPRAGVAKLRRAIRAAQAPP
ncbi:hypothetical protein J5Y09_01100 [Roseomonas sp. PWR1]|uniref:Uncharacterized protein n=1 Tax=Roseomonas nitratireducens TaxID=2820810 RepID=A0ABS4AMA7_9PROT|nr:hypothetical protein [Neoroseomonas nitratireducens]MBP0462495.1 hypothetical protein [Neoroseomonas nitratireducens]